LCIHTITPFPFEKAEKVCLLFQPFKLYSYCDCTILQVALLCDGIFDAYNDATIKAIRKLKDGQGQYLWQPSLTAGTPDTLLNRPVYTSAYAPILEAGSKTIAFGDFGYYWIADRQGRSFKRLNELFATSGQVGFLGSQRVDGKLILPEAIKVLQQKA
jgi:predicted phage gp36 major capsid-like protein